MVQQRRAGIFHFFFIGRLHIDFSRFEMRFGRFPKKASNIFHE
jgi:hypothetical protein